MFYYNMNIDTATVDELNEVEHYIKDQILKLLEAIKNTNLYFVIVILITTYLGKFQKSIYRNVTKYITKQQ